MIALIFILLSLFCHNVDLVAVIADGYTEPASSAYLAVKIQDPKISARVRNLHKAALNISKDFAPFLVAPDKLFQPLVAFRLEDEDVNRTSEIYDRKLQLALCQYFPRRIPYTEFKVVNPERYYYTGMHAMPQMDGWIKNVKEELLQSLNRHGFISLGDVEENMVVISAPQGINHRVSDINLRPIKLTASAYVDRIYLCRGPVPNGYSNIAPCDKAQEMIGLLFVSAILIVLSDAVITTNGFNGYSDPLNTAYIAFKINEPKITERVKVLHQAALNVSKDFAPFLVDPNQLVQPLLSFHLEADEVNRTTDIYDNRLRSALCQNLPRRIPYAGFRLVNSHEYESAIKAVTQVDQWITEVKEALIESLNRQGFILLKNLDESLIVATEPRGIEVIHRTSQIGVESVKLSASAYVDRFYICAGPAPNQYSASSCDVVYESPVITCTGNTDKEKETSIGVLPVSSLPKVSTEPTLEINIPIAVEPEVIEVMSETTSVPSSTTEPETEISTQTATMSKTPSSDPKKAEQTPVPTVKVISP